MTTDRAAGFTLLELLIVIACLALSLSIVLPRIGSASRQADNESIVAAEQVAAEQANDLDLDSRIAALCDRTLGSVYTFQIEGHEFRVKAHASEMGPLAPGDDRIVDYVSVMIDGTIVYERERTSPSAKMGQIGFYRGMGEWEHMLDEAERLVDETERIEREARFKSDLAVRYGPLPGFEVAE